MAWTTRTALVTIAKNAPTFTETSPTAAQAIVNWDTTTRQDQAVSDTPNRAAMSTRRYAGGAGVNDGSVGRYERPDGGWFNPLDQ